MKFRVIERHQVTPIPLDFTDMAVMDVLLGSSCIGKHYDITVCNVCM